MRLPPHPPLPNRAVQRQTPPGRLLAATALAALLIILAACGTTTQTPSSTAPRATTAPSATSTPSSYVVKVYFAHHPETDNDPNQVFSVQRTSPDLGVATFALKQLFLGPTADEKTQGYYSPFEGTLGAPNYCSDQSKDFALSLDHRGTKAEQGTATVTLCRDVGIPGDMAGFRMSAVITQTLLQFSNIKQVVILNHEGNCFNDLKGGNSCLNG